MVARLLLKLAPVGRILKAVPRPVWIAIIIAALLGIGSCVHSRKVKAFGDERFAAGVKAERDRAEAAEKKQAAKDERIAGKIKEQNREEADRINRDADTLRLSGPGRARCPAPAKPANGREPTSGQGSVAVDQVPSERGDELIALPFAPTVELAEQCDLNRAEVLAWRDWHKQLSESRESR